MVEFQRRHFVWFTKLMAEMDLTQVQTDWMIVKLAATNSNFNEKRFRDTLQKEIEKYGN